MTRTVVDGGAMNDTKTKAYLLEWVKHKKGEFSSPFAWPTDRCGYAQHMKFVEHRNKNWKGGTRADFDTFVTAYAHGLKTMGAPAMTNHYGKEKL